MTCQVVHRVADPLHLEGPERGYQWRTAFAGRPFAARERHAAAAASDRSGELEVAVPGAAVLRPGPDHRDVVHRIRLAEKRDMWLTVWYS